MKLSIVTLFSFLLLFSSCKELTGGDTGAGSGLFSNLIGGLNAVSTGGGKYILEGTAQNGGNAGHSFRLRFKLPEGETLKFFFYSSRDLSTGYQYTFTRTAGVVNLTLSLNGMMDAIELTAFNNSPIVDLDLDLHNDHEDAHMLIWDRDGEHGDTEGCTADGSCLYNSEDFAFDLWLGVGKGSGTYWGFSGDANLIKVLDGPNAALSDV